MRYLGIDYGEKRIGIAVSDPGGKIAFPKKVIFNRGNPRMWKQLKSLLEEEEISEIVVGLPVALDGRETEETRKVCAFAEILKKEISRPVHFENEMLTTHMVERLGVKREHTDAAAAAVILQSYLDRINRASVPNR